MLAVDVFLPSHLPGTLVDHGLDGEDVARGHDALGLVLGIVRDVGCRMEELADAVPTVSPHLEREERNRGGQRGEEVREEKRGEEEQMR